MALLQHMPTAPAFGYNNPVIARLLIAFVGAAAITVGLFLFMNDVSERMQIGDGTLYFKITDFIPAPDPGRQLPDAPALPELRPDTPDVLPADVEPAIDLDAVALEPEQQTNLAD